MRVLEAIGDFFATIFKAIIYGICAFFKGIWAVICWIAIMAVKYFLVYLPVLVMLGFAIFWILNSDGPDIDAFVTMNTLNGYDFKLTVLCVDWFLTNPEPIGLITLILIGAFIIFKLALVVIVAILEAIFVYLIYGLILTMLLIAIYFILMIAVFFVLPAAAVVYSAIFIKNSDYYDRWFYILCTILTTVCSVICYIYAFAAL